MSELPEKMKVLMVGGLPSDLQSVRGGVEAVILNLFAGFTRLDDVEVVHVAFTKEAVLQRIVQYSDKVKVYFVPFKSRFPLIDYWINREALRTIINTELPGIIHIQESEPHLLRFLMYPKQNIIVTQHGIMREELKYAKGLKDNLKFLFKTSIERFVFPLFKNIIFISHYNQQLFMGSASAFRIIYNPVNPIFFDLRNSSPVKNSMVYVGVINRRKNIRLILEALRQLKQRGINFQLHVVGGYKEAAFEAKVKQWISQFDLSTQVVFHGWLKQEEILEVFDTCTYFVLPSRQETLPMSVAEAMALGKIVLASNVGAISEMFMNGSTGFLFERDKLDQLTALLIRLNLESVEGMNDRIRGEAMEKFNPIEVARQTADFYREVIRQNKK